MQSKGEKYKPDITRAFKKERNLQPAVSHSQEVAEKLYTKQVKEVDSPVIQLKNVLCRLELYLNDELTLQQISGLISEKEEEIIKEMKQNKEKIQNNKAFGEHICNKADDINKEIAKLRMEISASVDLKLAPQYI